MAALLMPLDYEMQNIATKCYFKASKGIGNPKEMGFVLSRAALPQIYVSWRHMPHTYHTFMAFDSGNDIVQYAET